MTEKMTKILKLLQSSNREDRDIALEILNEDSHLKDEVVKLIFWLGQCTSEMDNEVDKILGFSSDSIYNNAITTGTPWTNKEVIIENIKTIIDAK